MRMSCTLLIAVALFATACTGGEEARKAAAAEARKTEWAALEKSKAELDAKRAELATLEAQAAAGFADAAARIEEVRSAIDAGEDDIGGRLAAYINADPPIVGEPMKPEQIAAIRMKSSEDMFIAREFIDLGGDYRKAIEIYQSALVADPDNAEVQAALAEAERMRYMTDERFAAVKKGMSEAEVRGALGMPYLRNVKEYPEQKVTAWFYPKNDAGDAAGVWFNDKKVVYQVKFDAVQAGGR